METKKSNNNMIIPVLGGLALLGFAIASSKKGPPISPPPVSGPYAFTLAATNLPSGAFQWSVAFQDPSSGDWYSPSNAPTGMGSHCLSSGVLAQMSVPVTAGVISILAAGTLSATSIDIIASDQVNLSGIVSGDAYTYDFNTGKITLGG